tara:strand:- start:4757 stop:6382 length:1626 start_codon:yes stop_codon:yes gene_type:complete
MIKNILDNIIKLTYQKNFKEIIIKSKKLFSFKLIKFLAIKILLIDTRKKIYLNPELPIIQLKLINFYINHLEDRDFQFLFNKIYNRFEKSNHNLSLGYANLANKYVQTFIKGEYEELNLVSKNLINYQRRFFSLYPRLKNFKNLYLDPNFGIALGHYSYLDIISKAIYLRKIKKKVYFFCNDKNFLFFQEIFKNINIIYTKNANLDYEIQNHILKNINKKDSKLIKNMYHNQPMFFNFFKINFFFHNYENKIYPFWQYGEIISSNFNKLNLNQKKLFEKNKKAFKEKNYFTKKTFWKKLIAFFQFDKHNNESKIDYVCIHVRENGYHRSWNRSKPSLRNSKFKNYFDAIKYLNKNGITVYRLGDSTMSSTSYKHKLFFDISKKKVSFRDQISLISNSKFCIFTNSGMSLFSSIFNVPNLYTNWVPIFILNWTPNDIFINKLILNTKTKKYLTINQMLNNFTSKSQFKKDYDLNKSYKIIDNFSDDILNSTININSEIDKSTLLKLNYNQKKIKTLLKKKNAVSLPKICPLFLKKYKLLNIN